MLEARLSGRVDRAGLAGAGSHRDAVDRDARGQRALERLTGRLQALPHPVGEHDLRPLARDRDDVRLGQIEAVHDDAHARDPSETASG